MLFQLPMVLFFYQQQKTISSSHVSVAVSLKLMLANANITFLLTCAQQSHILAQFNSALPA